jgi:hypothetical protein
MGGEKLFDHKAEAGVTVESWMLVKRDTVYNKIRQLLTCRTVAGYDLININYLCLCTMCLVALQTVGTLKYH